MIQLNKKTSKLGEYLIFFEKKIKKVPLRRLGYRSGTFWINQGLHFSKSDPNSQYSGGKLHTPQYSIRTGWGFSAIVVYTQACKPCFTFALFLRTTTRTKRCVFATQL